MFAHCLRSLKCFTITFALLAASCFTAHSSNTENNTISETNTPAHVEGYVSSDEKPLKDAAVTLYKGNEVVAFITSDKKGAFAFDFDFDAKYTVEISKEGYVAKRFCISTLIPEEAKKQGIPAYEFEASLLKESDLSKVDKEVLDFPFAIIKYSKDKQGFDYNVTYTNKMKIEEEKLILESYLLDELEQEEKDEEK